MKEFGHLRVSESSRVTRLYSCRRGQGISLGGTQLLDEGEGSLKGTP